MKAFFHDTDQMLAGYMPTVTRKLFYTILVVFVLFHLMILMPGIVPEIARRLFVFTAGEAILRVHVWQFVLHPLVAGNYWGLFFSLLGFFFLGGMAENHMGGRRYIWFLLLTTCLSALAHAVYTLSFGMAELALVGPGAILLGIFTVIVVRFPRGQFLFMMVFPMQTRVVALIAGVFLVLNILENVRAVGWIAGIGMNIAMLSGIPIALLLEKRPRILDFWEDKRIPFLMRRRPKKVPGRLGMGHPGRHTDPDDLYDDPHWKLDQ